MTIVQYFKQYISKLNEQSKCGFCWSYTYARKDYANIALLTDANKCCVHFILEYWKLKTVVDSDGDVKLHSYDFRAFVGLNSRFDIQSGNELKNEDEEQGKYKEYIEKVENCLVSNFHNDICLVPNAKMNSWSFTPAINKYDNNFDGGYIEGTISFLNLYNL